MQLTLQDIENDKKKCFIEQILKYGYFSDSLPPCFTTVAFAEKAEVLSKSIGDAKNCCSEPETLSIYKTELSRRIISIPNPEHYLYLVNFINENYFDIMNSSSSKHSQSKLSYFVDYNDNTDFIIDTNVARKVFKVSGLFLNSLRERILRSVGFKYKLSIDIASFYNSIYTHSITWATCGKEKAKKIHRHQAKQTDKYKLFDDFDHLIRKCNSDQTNGILIGPYTSRVFSEIILAYIDSELEKHNLVFKRYVDDYGFYFHTEQEAQRNIVLIERILNEFNLKINNSKTLIKSFPYEIVGFKSNHFDKSFKENRIAGVLNEASKLYDNGNKGAYKYALKYISTNLDNTLLDKESISLLINILLIDPRLSNEIIDLLNLSKENIDLKIMTKIINDQLELFIKPSHQQEELIFIYIAIILNIKIKPKYINEIMKSKDDFSILLVLIYCKNNNIQNKEYKKLKNRLANRLNKEDFYGPRWLLIYEVMYRKLIPASKLSAIKVPSFFRKMFKLHIDFIDL